MKQINLKLTARARREIRQHKLTDLQGYHMHFVRYVERYEEHPPANNVPTRNMIRALRLLTRQNTLEDWARLHVTEAFLRNEVSSILLKERAGS